MNQDIGASRGRRDWTGQIIGRWTVLHRDTRRPGGRYWICRCSCLSATVKSVLIDAARRGESRSCGCLRRELLTQQEDLVGRVFGQLTVTARVNPPSGKGRTRWACVCTCLNTTVVAPGKLRSGQQVSCGCYRRTRQSPRRTHGRSKTPLYRTWGNIVSRCYNPKAVGYELYGGRGITMDPRWRESFEAFAADVGEPPTPKHTLDRHPNQDGNYEPGNVRWATQKEQQRNRRNNVHCTLDGVTMTLVEWADRMDVPYKSLHWWMTQCGGDFVKVQGYAERFRRRRAAGDRRIRYTPDASPPSAP